MSKPIDSKSFDIQLKYVDTLDKDIIDSLYWYTNEGYTILNNSLRKNTSIINMYEDEEDFDFQHEIEYIYKRLYKQPITKQLYSIIYTKIKSQI